MSHEVELAVRVVALPLLGALAVVSALRDEAARSRLRVRTVVDDERAATTAVSWDRLPPELRALAAEWRTAR